MVGADHEPVGRVERVGDALPQDFEPRLCVEHPRREVELRLQLLLPLLAERRGHDDQDPALAFGPSLGDHEPGLDRLSEADFVGQDRAFRERRADGEERRVNLMRVEIDTRPGDRPGERLDASCRAPEGERVSPVLAVERSDQSAPAGRTLLRETGCSASPLILVTFPSSARILLRPREEATRPDRRPFRPLGAASRRCWTAARAGAIGRPVIRYAARSEGRRRESGTRCVPFLFRLHVATH